MTTYISIDGEFSGLDHKKHELISIGFCDCYNPTDNLYVEIAPTKPMDPAATRIHGLSEDYLLKNGLSRLDAATKIYNWLNNRKLAELDLIFVGYPVVLDWVFLDQLFSENHYLNPFHYEQMDIHTLGVVLLGLNPGFSQQNMRRLLNLKDQKNKHNALADAMHQAEEFVSLMNMAKYLRETAIAKLDRTT